MDAIKLLSTRRSISARNMSEPGPSQEQLAQMLTIAMRVPDHGKLAPWRFIVFSGPARQKAGERLADLIAGRPTPRESDIDYAKGAFLRAPVVVAVVSSAAVHPKIPVSEQLASGAAVAMTLCHAVHASGFVANWLTDWFAYDTQAKALLGIAANETVTGFIYIGSTKEPPQERPRPALAAHVSYFSA